MCLDYVDSEVKKTKGYGWKVFVKHNGKLYPRFQGLPYSKPFKLNAWVTETRLKREISSGEGGRYSAGFHIFATLEGARWWQQICCGYIRKVLYADVIITGRQSYKEVIVARKIFIEDK